MKRHRNPSFPIVPVILGAAGVAGLVWWVTRQSAIAATQAIVGGAAEALVAPLSYHGDVQGRVLTPAEIAAITANHAYPVVAPRFLSGNVGVCAQSAAVRQAQAVLA